MKKSDILFIAFSLASLLLAVPTGCAPAAVPAQYQVVSLDIVPAEMMVLETASVIAVIQNTGGTRGVYSAAITVDGEKIKTQDVLLDPGTTEKLTFTLQRNKAGTYKIGVGDKTAKLTVKSKLVPVQAELKYDNGMPADYISVVKPCTGYLVSFKSPADQFTVSDVRIFGLIFGGRGFSIRDIEVQIWDKDKRTLYSTTFPGKKFPLISYVGTNFETMGGWVEVYVPEIKTAGEFYVHVYAGLDTGQGFRMGADNSVTNTHSDVTIRDSAGADSIPESWPYALSKWYGDKSKVNWMVRVIGKAMVPEE
jgi:hypothetical protein